MPLVAGMVTVGSVSYPSNVLADFVLSDGETLVAIEPVLEAEANHGTFEGGTTGTVADTRENLAVPKDEQRSGGGGFNIPTGAPPSPLYCRSCRKMI